MITIKKNNVLMILFATILVFFSFSESIEKEKKIYIKKIEDKLINGDKIDWNNEKIEFYYCGWEDVDSNVYTMQYYSPEISKNKFERLDVADGIHPFFVRKSYGKSKDGRDIIADFELTSDKGIVLVRILKTYNEKYVNYDDFELKTTVYSFERMENYKYPDTFIIIEEYENVRTNLVNSEIIDERTPLKPKGIIKEYSKAGNLTAKISRIKPEFQIHQVYLSTGKLYKIETFNGVHEKLKTFWKETNLISSERIEAEKIEKYEKDYIYFLKNR